ncbi:molybdenum cofactor biosynthesis protein F, partial [Klebsiella pneumoniae]
MTSEAVFIQVGALADGFAPHGNLLATASLPAGENFTFYVAGSEPQQLVIEDEQTLSWNGKRAPWRATALRPDILFIDFLDPERDNASISAVCNLTQRNATLVYGQLPDEAAARLDAFSRVEQGLPLTAVEARFVFARLDAQPGPLPGFTDALIGMRNQYT